MTSVSRLASAMAALWLLTATCPGAAAVHTLGTTPYESTLSLGATRDFVVQAGCATCFLVVEQFGIDVEIVIGARTLTTSSMDRGTITSQVSDGATFQMRPHDHYSDAGKVRLQVLDATAMSLMERAAHNIDLLATAAHSEQRDHAAAGWLLLASM